MTDTQVFAWIFFSIQEELSSLQQIIGNADAINHAIPSHRELQMSLGWLQRQGLIQRKKKQYCLTKPGLVISKKVSSKSKFKTWDKTTEYLSKLSQDMPQLDDISEEDVNVAYKSYKKQFWQDYRKLNNKGAGQSGPGEHE